MSLRLEVLKCFKQLHNTRKLIFEGDDRVLKFARDQINSEFKKNKSVSDPTAIEELIKVAYGAEKEVKMTIVQAKEVKPGHYRLRILPETAKWDNVEFDEAALKLANEKDASKNECCKKK